MLMAVAGISLLRVFGRREQSHSITTRLTVALPSGDEVGLPDNLSLALSPKGDVLVYDASHEGKRQLFLRRLDRLEVKLLPRTEGGVNPFFSPDVLWVAFFA